MKYLVTIVLLTMVLVSGYSQTIDSVQIVHPNTHKNLKTIYTEYEMHEQLSKLNKKYKTDSFILFFYLSDNSVMRTKVRKDKPKQIVI